jgi:hypothetical protein
MMSTTECKSNSGYTCLIEDIFAKQTNIRTKLKQKLSTKVISGPSKEAWISLDKESN